MILIINNVHIEKCTTGELCIMCAVNFVNFMKYTNISGLWAHNILQCKLPD